MPRKPRILQCCSTSEPSGGIWTYIRHIKDSRLAERYHFDVCFYPGTSVGVSGRVIRELSRDVRLHAPELVHLHGLQTEGFNCMMGAMRGSDAPRLLTVHGFIEDSRFRSPWRRLIIAHVLEPITLRCADAVVAVSRYGAAKPMLRRRTRENLGFINNGIPPQSSADPLASAAVRAHYGWSTSDVVAICVARLSREKGLLDLAEAFAELAPRHPDFRLLLAGDGPDAHLLRTRLGTWITAGRVVLQPATADISPLLGAADFFVLPSLHEHQSFAILEAMSAGLPVLSTQVGGTPELIKHDETGVLVPPLQPGLLAGAMEQLVVDPALRLRLGRAGVRSVGTRHSHEQFIDQIGSVYGRMLEKASGQSLRNGDAQGDWLK